MVARDFQSLGGAFKVENSMPLWGLRPVGTPERAPRRAAPPSGRGPGARIEPTPERFLGLRLTWLGAPASGVPTGRNPFLGATPFLNPAPGTESAWLLSTVPAGRKQTLPAPRQRKCG